MRAEFATKLGHAAALALVGWYLIAPPINSHGDIRIDAPLAYWELEMSFISATGCESARNVLQNWAIEDKPRSEAQLEAAESAAEGFSLLFRPYQLEVRVPAAICIASNDPRLDE